LLPSQIGAQNLAFPSAGAVALWATLVSFCGIVASFFLAPEPAISIWIGSVAVFCAAALLSSINFTVTVIDARAKGMTLPRMPVTVWAWCINAILGMLIYSILLAACVCLLADRCLGTHIYAMQPSFSTVEWQRLFWFFAQAQIYVALLPCFGLVTHLIAT